MIKRIIPFIVLLLDIALSFLPFFKWETFTESMGADCRYATGYDSLFEKMVLLQWSSFVFPVLFALQLVFLNHKKIQVSLFVTWMLGIFFCFIIQANNQGDLGVAPYLFFLEQIAILLYSIYLMDLKQDKGWTFFKTLVFSSISVALVGLFAALVEALPCK